MDAKHIKLLRNTQFQNKPNRRKLKSDISETVIATCEVSAGGILSSISPII